MNRYSFDNNGYTYKRINKTAAEKAYTAGKTVIIIPCNLRPFTNWHCEYALNRKNREQFVIDETGIKNDFYNYINSFEYYNCINSETGKYTAFYIQEEEQ